MSKFLTKLSKNTVAFLHREHFWRQAIFIYLSFYLLAITIPLLGRWQQFEIYYFDHGIFDQSLWHVAHGRMPLFDHFDNFRLNQLGDHFTPTLYLLAPIYWLTASYLPLLIVQNLLLVAALYVLYLLGRQLQLKNFLTFAVIFATSLFVGLQNGIIAGFHTELIALLTFSLALLFLEQKKFPLMWLFLILTLGCKELLVALLMAVALLLLIKKERQQAMALFVFSLGYYFLSTRVIIPFFRQDEYLYQMPHFAWHEFLTRLFSPLIKSRTIFLSLASFFFLPLLAWPVWPLILQDLILRFVFVEGGASWDLSLHYSLMLTLILAYGSLMAFSRQKKPQLNLVLAGLMILASLFLNYRLHGPINMVFNRAFYTQTKNLNFLSNFIDQIPNQGLLMVPNNLAVKLTHSHDVMLLRSDYWQFMPNVIALDVRAGQGANNYWPANLDELYARLQTDPNYVMKKVTDEQLIFTKIAQPDLSIYQVRID